MRDRTKLIIGLSIILGTLALGFWQWDVMKANEIQASTFNTEATTLSAVQNKLLNDYQDIKADVDNVRNTSSTELSSVFPTDEDITNLTRLFDEFAMKNNFASNPFFISSINYQGEQKTETDYRFVPATISVTTSKKNLGEFMEFIETSGSLEGKVRLMSIEEMTLSYPAEYGGTYDAKFTINAYFSPEI